MTSVLVADEDPVARADMQRILGSAVSATLCSNGAEALWQAGRVTPAVVLLSATLPVVAAADVAAVLTDHRQGHETIVVAVGFGEADLAGPVLAAGANGVVSRPYQSREIEPLVRAHVARTVQHQRRAAVLSVGPLRLDEPAFEAFAGGRPMRLTLREFELLHLLMLHAGKVVSKDYIRQQLWGSRSASVTFNTIAVHVRHLRAHLKGVADILVVRGVGYRLSLCGGDAVSPSRFTGATAEVADLDEPEVDRTTEGVRDDEKRPGPQHRR